MQQILAPLRERMPGLADSRLVLSALAAAVRPRRCRWVSDWARAERWVSRESGSPVAIKAGRDVRWDHQYAPYLPEIMDCMSFQHPCFEVVIAKSAQVGVTEAGLNFVGQCIDEDPAPGLYLLPSLEEMKKFVRVKLQPAIDATPALASKVRDLKARDEDASTSAMKRYPGGYLAIATARSSKGLQMVSYRFVVMEEVSEYPFETGDRGDPMDQAVARTKAYRDTIGAKVVYISTLGLKGNCRITTKLEASDMRRLYVPCPHCGLYQVLRWHQLRWRSDRPDHGAYFVCRAHGCIIEPEHKDAMLRRFVWLKTYPAAAEPEAGDPETAAARRARVLGEFVEAHVDPAQRALWADRPDAAPEEILRPDEVAFWQARPSNGRSPGFHLWQAYATFVAWGTTVAEFIAAGGDQAKLKTFTQQTLGEPWEEKGGAPDAEKLAKLVLSRDELPPGRLPPGALFVTGFADVQSYGLKWGVYAWGYKLESWRIDGGLIEGDPAEDTVWKRLAAVVATHYPDAAGHAWPIDAFGVDTGYLSPRVYLFVRQMQDSGYRRVFATDGRGGQNKSTLPPLGSASNVAINWRGKRHGKVRLWPIGTWGMKLEVFAALHRLLRAAESPLDPDGQPWRGLPRFGADCDLNFFKELTAEHLKSGLKDGRPYQYWHRGGTNDQLDIMVGARALAHHLGVTTLTEEEWAALARARQLPADHQPGLFDGPHVQAADLRPPVRLPGRLKVATAPVASHTVTSQPVADPAPSTPAPTPAPTPPANAASDAHAVRPAAPPQPAPTAAQLLARRLAR